MSTQPQLSPIEQLMQSQPSTPAQPQGQGDLSPIEQLMQGSQADQPITMQPLEGDAVDVSGLTQQQVSDTKSAEQTMGKVALGTIGTVAGAPLASEAGAAMRLIAHEYGAPAITALEQAAASHPFVAKLIGHALVDTGLLGVAKWVKLFGK